MATPSVLAFDAEGQAIDFDIWVDDLQLFLQCDRADGLSLFDLTSGASPAPAADAYATVRSQWATRDAAARLAVRRHLPTSERVHFSQYKSAQTLYDVSLTSLRTSALVTLATALRFVLSSAPRTPSPMYITLYYVVTRLPDSLRVVRDHFLSVCPTTLTVDLLEKSLLAAKKSIVPVGASRGDPRTPIFEGRSVRRLPLAGDAALARARGAGALGERAGAVEVEVEAAGGVGVAVGVEAGVEVSVAAVEAEAAAPVAVGAEVAEVAAVEEAAEAAVVAEAAKAAEAAGVAVELVAGLRRGVATMVVRASSSSAVVRPCPLSSSVSGTLHASGVGVLVRAPTSCAPATVRRHQFPEAIEIPRWGELSSAGVAIYDLDFDAILSAMYAVSISDEGDCYRCFPPDPGIETAALGTAASGQVFAAASRSGPESAPCSGRLLSHKTLLWHHRLGHPSLPRLRGMASRVLVCGLPRSLPPLPPGPSPTCVPYVEGRLRAAPHSSQFPPTEAPLQTLHMDVWGLARVRGQGHERYFLLVVDDYSRYTTVFPLRSKGDVGDASAFRVWGSRAFVRDLSADKLSPRAAPCVFLGFPPDAPGLQFYHPTSRRVLSSQDVTFDESVPYYRLFPYRTPSLPPPPLFLVPGPPPVDPLPPQGPAPSGVSQVDAVEPVEVAGDSGAAEGAEPGGADSGGAERVGATPGGAEPEGATTWGAEPGGAKLGGAEPGGAMTGVLSLGFLRLEVLSLRSCVSGLPGAGGVLLEQEVLRLLRVLVSRVGGARTRSTGAAGPAGTT
ncbi:unnamed protein product [Closterium sp. NIES-64]|nr:unnamed protein product [Closterium sp. NIES-64]